MLLIIFGEKLKDFGLKPLCEDYYQKFEVIKSVDAGDGNVLKFDNFSGKVKKILSLIHLVPMKM